MFYGASACLPSLALQSTLWVRKASVFQIGFFLLAACTGLQYLSSGWEHANLQEVCSACSLLDCVGAMEYTQTWIK